MQMIGKLLSANTLLGTPQQHLRIWTYILPTEMIKFHFARKRFYAWVELALAAASAAGFSSHAHAPDSSALVPESLLSAL